MWLRQNKLVRTFLWKTMSWLLTTAVWVITMYQSSVPQEYIFLLPIVYGVIDMLIKHINVVHLNDLWVDK